MEINCIAPKRALQLSGCNASSTLGVIVLAKIISRLMLSANLQKQSAQRNGSSGQGPW